MRSQNIGKRISLLWKLAASFSADKASLTGFRQAGFQRCIPAKLGQVIIRPGNGGHPEAQFHKYRPFKIQLFRCGG
jgi:hypothetical protein